MVLQFHENVRSIMGFPIWAHVGLDIFTFKRKINFMEMNEGSLLFICYCYLIKECRWSFVNPPSTMKGKQCHNCFHVMLQNDFFPAFMPVTCRYDGIPFFCLLQNRFIAWWCGQKVSLLAHVSNYFLFRKDSRGTRVSWTIIKHEPTIENSWWLPRKIWAGPNSIRMHQWELPRASALIHAKGEWDFELLSTFILVCPRLLNQQ